MATTAGPAIPRASSATILPGHTRKAVRGLSAGVAYWHLLSLDAPTVAMLWTWFLAKASHIALPAAAVAAMGLAVWMLYASDRLLDSRVLTASVSPNDHHELELRHYFHRTHRRSFRLGILAASAALTVLLPRLDAKSIHLYLVLGILLFGYFILIHANSANASQRTQRLPKELAVGLFFSAATFIPTIARAPELRAALLPAAILFAFLCSLNCLFIYAWEHPVPSPQTHAATRIALRFLPHFAVAALLAALMIKIADPTLSWAIPAACALSICLLVLLHRRRRRVSPTTLRAAADLCLLTPALLLPFLLF